MAPKRSRVVVVEPGVSVETVELDAETKRLRWECYEQKAIADAAKSRAREEKEEAKRLEKERKKAQRGRKR